MQAGLLRLRDTNELLQKHEVLSPPNYSSSQIRPVDISPINTSLQYVSIDKHHGTEFNNGVSKNEEKYGNNLETNNNTRTSSGRSKNSSPLTIDSNSSRIVSATKDATTSVICKSTSSNTGLFKMAVGRQDTFEPLTKKQKISDEAVVSSGSTFPLYREVPSYISINAFNKDILVNNRDFDRRSDDKLNQCNQSLPSTAVNNFPDCKISGCKELLSIRDNIGGKQVLPSQENSLNHRKEQEKERKNEGKKEKQGNELSEESSQDILAKACNAIGLNVDMVDESNDQAVSSTSQHEYKYQGNGYIGSRPADPAVNLFGRFPHPPHLYKDPKLFAYHDYRRHFHPVYDKQFTDMNRLRNDVPYRFPRFPITERMPNYPRFPHYATESKIDNGLNNENRSFLHHHYSQFQNYHDYISKMQPYQNSNGHPNARMPFQPNARMPFHQNANDMRNLYRYHISMRPSNYEVRSNFRTPPHTSCRFAAPGRQVVQSSGTYSPPYSGPSVTTQSSSEQAGHNLTSHLSLSSARSRASQYSPIRSPISPPNTPISHLEYFKFKSSTSNSPSNDTTYMDPKIHFPLHREQKMTDEAFIYRVPNPNYPGINPNYVRSHSADMPKNSCLKSSSPLNSELYSLRDQPNSTATGNYSFNHDINSKTPMESYSNRWTNNLNLTDKHRERSYSYPGSECSQKGLSDLYQPQIYNIPDGYRNDSLPNSLTYSFSCQNSRNLCTSDIDQKEDPSLLKSTVSVPPVNPSNITIPTPPPSDIGNISNSCRNNFSIQRLSPNSAQEKSSCKYNSSASMFMSITEPKTDQINEANVPDIEHIVMNYCNSDSDSVKKSPCFQNTLSDNNSTTIQKSTSNDQHNLEVSKTQPSLAKNVTKASAKWYPPNVDQEQISNPISGKDHPVDEPENSDKRVGENLNEKKCKNSDREICLTQSEKSEKNSKEITQDQVKSDKEKHENEAIKLKHNNALSEKQVANQLNESSNDSSIINKKLKKFSSFKEKLVPVLDHLLSVPEADTLRSLKETPEELLVHIVSLWGGNDLLSKAFDPIEKIKENFMQMVRLLFKPHIMEKWGWNQAEPEQILDDLINPTNDEVLGLLRKKFGQFSGKHGVSAISERSFPSNSILQEILTPPETQKSQ